MFSPNRILQPYKALQMDKKTDSPSVAMDISPKYQTSADHSDSGTADMKQNYDFKLTNSLEEWIENAALEKHRTAIVDTIAKFLEKKCENSKIRSGYPFEVLKRYTRSGYNEPKQGVIHISIVKNCLFYSVITPQGEKVKNEKIPWSALDKNKLQTSDGIYCEVRAFTDKQGHTIRATPFDTYKIPDFSVSDYLKGFLRRDVELSVTLFIGMYILLDHYNFQCKKYYEQLNPYNIYRLILASMLVVSKFLDDNNLNLAGFALLGGCSKSETILLETELLKKFNWDLFSTLNLENFQKYLPILLPDSAKLENSTGIENLQKQIQDAVTDCKSNYLIYEPKKDPVLHQQSLFQAIRLKNVVQRSVDETTKHFLPWSP